MTATISSNYVSDILDEIALEGLDGITLDALWKRLSVRPRFCFNIDEQSKKFLWNIVVRMYDVSFYEIAEPRPALVYYDSVSPEDYQKAIEEIDALYPYSSVKNAQGIFGSCQDYLTRNDVSVQVKGHSLKEVDDIWGSRLILVASQECRKLSLFGNLCAPNLDFSKTHVQYDILERIGKCRYLGVPTSGKASLLCVAEDSKSVFHYVKFLLGHKLIKKQSLVGCVQASSNSSRIYLTRFYREHLNEYQYILQTGIEELKHRPNTIMAYDEFYGLFDGDKKKRIHKYIKSNHFRKYINLTKPVAYRSVFPDAQQSEWEKKSKTGEKFIRCFQLIHPNMDVMDIFENEEESDEDDVDIGFQEQGVYYKDVPLLTQAYHHIKAAGALGMSHVELEAKMGFGKTFVRALLKRLQQDKLCTTFFENDGRRRTKRYMVGENAKNKAAASELAQILSEKSTATACGSTAEALGNGGKSSRANGTKLGDCSGSNEVEKPNLIPGIDQKNFSYRESKRIGYIIKTIRTNRYRRFWQIAKHVREEEVKEGLTAEVDRQTLRRLLRKLADDGYIKMCELSEKGDKPNQSIELYMEPTFTLDEKLEETLTHTHTSYSALDTASSFEGMGRSEEGPCLEKQFSKVLLENLVEVKKMLQNIVHSSDKSAVKESKDGETAYSPKFMRLSMIHDLLFYLVYEYTGLTNRSQDDLVEELSKTCAIDGEMRKEMPRVYRTQVSPYLFVPPLTPVEGRVPGWLLMSDVIVRMPLSIFVKIFRIGEFGTELRNYLQHPVKKHYLIKDLPLCVQQNLFNRKQFLTPFYCDFKRLCFIGLIQFGIKYGKEFYQTAIYLNRKASLLDTSTSPPDYYQVPSDMEFEVKCYHFEATNDVRNYWNDMGVICLATNLGVKSGMIGKEIPVDRELSKESLKIYLEPTTVVKAIEKDDGKIPGDRLGAAGIDSVMFSYLKSSWLGFTSRCIEPSVVPKKKKLRPKIAKLPLKTIRREHPIKKAISHGRSWYKKPLKKSVVSGIRSSLPVGDVPRPQRKREVGKRVTKYKRDRKTSYDEVDKEALRKMNSLRVSWSADEDNLLLVCKAAMMYICPNLRSFVKIPVAEVRQVLHENLRESGDKTQKAIKRRITNMMKHQTNERTVSLCLEELKQIAEVGEKFECSQLVEKIKPSTPNVKELQAQLYERFHDLVEYMRQRFINGENFGIRLSRVNLLPDSLDELVKKYEMQPETASLLPDMTVKDIHQDVIRAILMSHLSCRSDKTSSAAQLFEIYRQYEQDELENAIRKLKGDKVITFRKKANSAAFRDGPYLPLARSPYRLSYALTQLLNTKYNQQIYSESYNQIRRLMSKEETTVELHLSESNLAVFLLASREMLTLSTTVPDKIITIDKGQERDNAHKKKLDGCQKVANLRNTCQGNKLVCISGKVIGLEDEQESREGNEKESRSPVEDEMDPKKNESGQNVVTRKRSNGEGVAGLCEDEEDGDRKIKREKRDEGTEGGEIWVECGEKSESSRDGMCVEEESRQSESSEDSESVNASKESGKSSVTVDSENVSQESGMKDVKVEITKKTEEMEKYGKQMEKLVVSKITDGILSRCFVPLNLVKEDVVTEEFDGDREQRKILVETLRFVESKKEFGVTNRELREVCSNDCLSEVIKHLVSSKIVIKTGIEQTTYIGQKYCSPWLLSSFKMTRLERENMGRLNVAALDLSSEGSEDDGQRRLKRRRKGSIKIDVLKNDSLAAPAGLTDKKNNVQLIIRPWIRIDGTLNRRVLDRFLGSVLGHVMANPGISVKAVMNKFRPGITPVWTKDLVEILREIGCIQFLVRTVVRKASLFSKSCVKISEKCTGFEEDEDIMIEAEVDAINRLALFIGQKNYSNDFLCE